MQVKFRVFSSGGVFTGPEMALTGALKKAAAFASTLAPGQLVGFSQSTPQTNMAYATVWYWTGVNPGSASTANELTVDESNSDESIVEDWLDQPDSE
jgi:hypothetical protein